MTRRKPIPEDQWPRPPAGCRWERDKGIDTRYWLMCGRWPVGMNAGSFVNLAQGVVGMQSLADKTRDKALAILGITQEQLESLR